MALLELPSNDGKIIAVNPHHVTAVQPYFGFISGKEGKQEMCVIWVARDQGTNLYVCAWTIEATMDALNAARRDDFNAFEAGFRAVARHLQVEADPTRIWAAFCEWQGKEVPA